VLDDKVNLSFFISFLSRNGSTTILHQN
jgi:hypothetical protein